MSSEIRMFIELFCLVLFLTMVRSDCPVYHGGMTLAVHEGHEWKDHCDVCKCLNGKVECNGGPACSIPHSEALEWTCITWDENKCCCLKQGCVGHDDQEYLFGEWMPMDASGCEKCLCSEHTIKSECKIETTPECINTKHDHPFESNDLHHHQNTRR